MPVVGPARTMGNRDLPTVLGSNNVPSSTLKSSSSAVANASKSSVSSNPTTTTTTTTNNIALTRNWMSSSNPHKALKEAMVKNDKLVWLATFGYFGYVVLGGVNKNLHKHIYTGDENLSLWERLKKGQPVVFSESVYDEFFSFKAYFGTYKWHILCAGSWLLTGVYNLRNNPSYAGSKDGKPLYNGWLHARLSGYVYALCGFVKAVTAGSLSLRSESLGLAKWPMVAYSLWDVYSLVVAVNCIRNGKVGEHRKWMIRNFGIGAGSIWVRVFGMIWGMFDLSFMHDNDLYRSMNTVVLTAGFTQGWIFSEWWLAETPQAQRKWAIAQLALWLLTAYGAREVYQERNAEEYRKRIAAGAGPAGPGAADETTGSHSVRQRLEFQ